MAALGWRSLPRTFSRGLLSVSRTSSGCPSNSVLVLRFSSNLTRVQEERLSRPTNKLVLDKTLVLSSKNSLQHIRPKNTTLIGNLNSSKGLVIMFSYLMAKERHLEKYREMYYANGYEVLTVRTTPLDFLFPAKGARRVATNLLDTLANHLSSSPPPAILVHGFSVGGYQFAEFSAFLQQKAESERSSNSDHRPFESILKAIRGTIFDSPCDIDSVPYGFSRTVAGETLIGKSIESLFHLHNKLFYSVSKKYHADGARVFEFCPLRCPALFLASKDDKLADINVIERVMKTWKSQGVSVSIKCWDSSRHVSHLHKYPDEYRREIERFLMKIAF